MFYLHVLQNVEECWLGYCIHTKINDRNNNKIAWALNYILQSQMKYRCNSPSLCLSSSLLTLTRVQAKKGAFRSTRLALCTRARRPRVDGGAWLGARDNIPVQRPSP